jgi:type II secretory pathway component PulL
MAKRGRPIGTGKPAGEKYVLKAFKFPPELWEAFARIVPENERSKTIRGYMEKEIRKKGRAAGEGSTDSADGARSVVE